MIAGNADTEILGEVAHDRPFDMELRAALVIRIRIFGIEREANRGRDFPTGLGIEPGHGGSCIDCPAVEAGVGEVPALPEAHGHVEERLQVPMPVAGVPSDQRRPDWISVMRIAVAEVALNCDAERGREIELRVDADILPTDRDDDAEPDAAVQHLDARYPEQRRHIVVRLRVEADGNDPALIQPAAVAAAVVVFEILEIDAGWRRHPCERCLRAQEVDLRRGLDGKRNAWGLGKQDDRKADSFEKRATTGDLWDDSHPSAPQAI